MNQVTSPDEGRRMRRTSHPDDVDGLDGNFSSDEQATNSLHGETVVEGVEVVAVDPDLQQEKQRTESHVCGCQVSMKTFRN